MQNWSRREHYKVFSSFNHPHFGMCANVDLTTFLPAVKQRELSFTATIVYVLARAANAIPEFRYRIRGENVVEHEIVHPSVTVLANDDLFTFCTIAYSEDFSEYVAGAAAKLAYVKEHPTLEEEPGQDDLLFLTALPWVSFTSFMHPMQLHPADSVPRFAYGKFFEEGEFLKMPLGVQGHHALMDGIHMARFYANVQDLLDHPGFLAGQAQDR